MAIIDEKARRIICQRIGLTTDDAKAAALDAIEAAWANVASIRDWWFMLKTDRESVTITAGVDTVTIDRLEIGFLRAIVDANDVELYRYRSPEDWARLRGGTANVTPPAGTPSYFTLKGIDSGKLVLQLESKPLTSLTAYATYTLQGSLANIDDFPLAWLSVLVQKAMAMMAPPIQIAPERWMAINRDADDLFERDLEKMLHHSRVVPFYRPEPEIDSLAQEVISECEDFI